MYLNLFDFQFTLDEVLRAITRAVNRTLIFLFRNTNTFILAKHKVRTARELRLISIDTEEIIFTSGIIIGEETVAWTLLTSSLNTIEFEG